MVHANDRSCKWLIEHFADVLLRIGGITGYTKWQVGGNDLVQSLQIPDGFIEVTFPDGRTVVCLVEATTYPDHRVETQLHRDAAMVFLSRGQVPELLTFVLRPKGNVAITPGETLTSVLGYTTWQIHWRVINLWELSAEDLLASNDVGVIPWALLARSERPAEELLSECRQRIDAHAAADLKGNLLAVCQILGRIQYDPQLLRRIFMSSYPGRIDSPFWDDLLDDDLSIARSKAHKRLLANERRSTIVKALATRFAANPSPLNQSLASVSDPEQLADLLDWALTCGSLQEFASKLSLPK
jgi:predicted transposase YdaD